MKTHQLTPRRLIAVLIGGLLVAGVASTAGAADENAARTLARQSNCFKCHAIDKKKDGPSWKEVAEKYRKKGDPAKAEERLVTHITSGEKAKFEDGHEEDHPIVKTKDQKEIKNLVDWILSLQ
jgi:cytochrome c